MFKLLYYASFLIMGVISTCSNNKNMTQISANKPRPDWLKSVYYNAVMIEERHCSMLDDTYLIDLPIHFHPDSAVIFFVSAKLPIEFFRNINEFYPELTTFTVVIPDHDFYDKIAKDANKQGLTLEPVTTNYYYHITRQEDKVIVDQYHLSGEQPKLNYVTPKISKNNLVVYRTESYGSICCPKDGKRILEKDDENFVRNYEMLHGVNIVGSYRQINGKEGEHSNYYTLQKLGISERLAFLVAKNKQWQYDGKTLIPLVGQHIITPEIVPLVTEGIRKMEPISYEYK